MRHQSILPAALLIATLPCTFSQTIPSPATVIVDDTFADANSQNQDLAANSLWLFNGRTTNIRTDTRGAATFDVTPNGGSSEGFWAFFTKSGSPLVLGVGDRLSVAVTFSVAGFQNNGQDIRWGVFDSLATRNTANLGGGMNDATFINDPGYGLDYFASGPGSPFVIGRRAVLSNANVFNNFGDFATINGSGATERQPLKDGVAYTLTYTIERLTGNSTRITTSVTGAGLTALGYSATENSPTPQTSFDYFAFRISGTAFSNKITFSELLVQYIPAPPVISSQPQQSRLTLQVGSRATIAIGATGSQLSYQWQRDGKPLSGNPSALTPTLTIDAVKLADAGSYAVVVSNAGGVAIYGAAWRFTYQSTLPAKGPIGPAPNPLLKP